jgi:pimeloyl-ACP methyl ester carboxylesterase
MSAGAWALHADLESVLPNVGARTPTTVVWGETDRLLPLEAGRRMAQLLGARLVLVAGDHDWLLRHPARFASVLLSIVDDTRIEIGLRAVPPSA